MSMIMDRLKVTIRSLVDARYKEFEQEIFSHFNFFYSLNTSGVVEDYSCKNSKNQNIGKLTLGSFKLSDEDIIENEIEIAQYTLDLHDLIFMVSEIDGYSSKRKKLEIDLYNKKIELLESRILSSNNELKLKIYINEIIEYVEGTEYAID